MSDPYLDFVAGFALRLQQGRRLPAPPPAAPPPPPVAADAPVCLLFSPHPDDEAIGGALAWRLRQEARWRVVNVAVTLGSHVQRRAERWQELAHSCARLGFECVSASGESVQGLQDIGPSCASARPQHWASCVARVLALLHAYQPRVVVCPHALDGHPAHIGTHHLVRDALADFDRTDGPHLLLGEYWNTQMEPRLMLELGSVQVADLMAALSLHVGEVARNPYHLTLPAWFMDGVRRGAERVGGAGASAPGFSFAALYGWQRWQGGILQPQAAQIVSLSTPIATLFD